MIKSHKCKTMNLKKVVSFVSEVLEPYIEIPVPSGETVLTKAHVQAFLKENPDATHVRIPESVIKIDRAAFYECRELKSVILPGSVIKIGDIAFWECSGLEWVTILGGGATIGGATIGENVFRRCSGLKSLTLLERLSTISRNAFRECTGLKSVNLPEGVSTIGDNAFWECSGLEWVRIPEGVTKIGINAFRDCTGLKSATLPESVNIIGSNAFMGCTGLKSATLPESVNIIGSDAFSGCSGVAILAPSNLMEDPQLTSIPGVSLYDRSSKDEVLVFNKLPQVLKFFNPFFSIKSFNSNRCLYNNEQRSFILNLLLVAERLDRLSNNQESVDGNNEGVDSPQTLRLPPELWIHILGFVQRLDMNARPAALDNNDQDEDEYPFEAINDGADNGFCVE